tara:strand:+ start:659 stop:808 length:150 start_codon:yes stop_codon:yes gene_type:complete
LGKIGGNGGGECGGGEGKYDNKGVTLETVKLRTYPLADNARAGAKLVIF